MPNTPVTGQIADQKTETPRPFSLGREQILTRLWELAYLSPEMTRGSITGQIKAMSMIVAIEGLIPDRPPLCRPGATRIPNRPCRNAGETARRLRESRAEKFTQPRHR